MNEYHYDILVKSLNRVYGVLPPGHRYSLYFRGWDERKWEIGKDKKKEILDEVIAISGDVRSMIDFLKKRQEYVASKSPGTLFNVRGETTSPFTTGLGGPHPLDNGFAFLSPYGIPYLPGASIKGVIRRSAEELVLFEKVEDLNIIDVWMLFGFDANSGYFKPKNYDALPDIVREETERWIKAYREVIETIEEDDVKSLDSLFTSEDTRKRWLPDRKSFLVNLCKNDTDTIKLRGSIHLKGSIVFWDAYPLVSENMKIEIMNPHHRGYYEGKNPPGDWEDPNPILYLALPAGTRFTFHASFFPPEGVPHGCSEKWKNRLEKCFERAFDITGFGAKTALGYGAMERREEKAVEKREEPSDDLYGGLKMEVGDFSLKDKGKLPQLLEKISGVKDEKVQRELFMVLVKMGEYDRDLKKRLKSHRLWEIVNRG